MQSNPRFFALTAHHAAVLDEQRAAIEDLRDQVFERGRAPSLIETAQVLLERRIIPVELIGYQEAIGVVIGDNIVSRAGFRWLTVQSGDISEPSICHPEKSVFVSPMSAVVK